jgi:hypothetical protein
MIFERLQPSNLPEAVARCRPEADASQEGIAPRATRLRDCLRSRIAKLEANRVIERL